MAIPLAYVQSNLFLWGAFARESANEILALTPLPMLHNHTSVTALQDQD